MYYWIMSGLSLNAATMALSAYVHDTEHLIISSVLFAPTVVDHYVGK